MLVQYGSLKLNVVWILETKENVCAHLIVVMLKWK